MFTEKHRDHALFFSSLFPSFLYNFSSAILLNKPTGCMSVIKSMNIISFIHQVLLVCSPLTFNTNDVLCKSKWENMLRKIPKGQTVGSYETSWSQKHLTSLGNYWFWNNSELIKTYTDKLFSYWQIKVGSCGMVYIIIFFSAILTLINMLSIGMGCVNINKLAEQRIFSHFTCSISTLHN